MSDHELPQTGPLRRAPERRMPEGMGYTREQRLIWIRHLADTGDWYSAIVQLADIVEEQKP